MFINSSLVSQKRNAAKYKYHNTANCSYSLCLSHRAAGSVSKPDRRQQRGDAMLITQDLFLFCGSKHNTRLDGN